MTSSYERRIRRLEAATPRATGGHFAVFGLPGRPDPTDEEVAQACGVLTVRFVTVKDGRIVDARH